MRVRFLVSTSLVFSVFGILSQPSFAQNGPNPQVIGNATPTPLSPTGVTNGVAMTGGGPGELDVGTVGGPEMDIFTNNSALTPPLEAVSTQASSLSNIV